MTTVICVECDGELEMTDDVLVGEIVECPDCGVELEVTSVSPLTIELAPEVFDDFDRFFDHIAQYDPGSAPERIGAIVDAIQILGHSPQIGRPVQGGKRELVIGRAARGYVALYHYIEAMDTVFVLAVRSQREVGFKR